jgi:hypothetical protein
MNYKGFNLTNEQFTYITFNKKIDTKLLACAGSGKTQCIVLKNIFLLENKIYKPDEILIIVFGKHAQNDLINRINGVDKDKLINTEMVMTIDAFSKYIIDTNNRIDVSLLSYKFMEYLQNSSIDELKQNIKLNSIKTIFIDEAQDLNLIQFNIVNILKEKLGIILNFIGDYNQNIFQFRDSESKYFADFNAKEFFLTTNFRSHPEIIEFSSNLRIDTTYPILSSKDYINIKPTFYEGDVEDKIVKLINEFMEDPLNDLSDIAIISPVKGKINKHNSYGLCYISNILTNNNIKFEQFYDESKEEASQTKKYEPKKGHCSLITVFGSKGLQWKHVILVDVKTSLINYYTFNEKQHQNEKNLLYVACSRSIETLSIVIEANKKSLKLNNWFKFVDKDTYDFVSDSSFGELKFPEMQFRNEKLHDNRITKILDNIPINILNELSNIIDYENLVFETEKIYDFDYSKIEYGYPIFLGIYTESFFVNCNNIKNNENLKEYTYLNNICNDKIIFCDKQKTYDWIEKNKNMTIQKYDLIKHTLNTEISNEINNMRTKRPDFNFNSYNFIIENKYYNQYINLNIEYIKDKYNKYKSITNDYNSLKKLQFFCEIFMHSIKSHHYYHIANKGKKFKKILLLYNEMFDQIKNYVDCNDLIFNQFNQFIEKYNLIGEIDMIDENGELWEIKVVKNISLKNILQLLMYNIMYFDNITNFKLNFLNFLKGDKVHININLSIDKINRILEIFQIYSTN